MANLPASQWFFEVLGKKAGPYSTEQILELHRTGQLGLAVRLIPDSSGHHEITLEELIGLSQFQPPPKPEIGRADHHVTPGADPSMSLFDALQAAKDRKAAAPKSADEATSAAHENSSMFPGMPELPPLAWFAIAGLAGMTLGGWAIYSYVGRGAAPAALEARSEKTRPRNEPVRPSVAQTAEKPAAAPVRPVVPVAAQRPNLGASPFGRLNKPITAPRSPASEDARRKYDERRDEREREREREREQREREDSDRRGDDRHDEEPIDADPNAPKTEKSPDAPKPAESGDPAETPADPESSRID